MESFSLLKYWRASTTIVAITTGTGEELPHSSTSARSTTTTSVANEAPTEEEEEEADGSFFDLELSSVLIKEQDESDSTSESLDAADTKTLHHHSPPGASLLKSATRFRVFALGLNKKLKSESESDTNASAAVDSPKSTSSSSSINNFLVEVLAGSRNNNSKAQDRDRDPAEEEKKFSKEVVQKYINSKIKSLYARPGGDPTKKKKKVVMVKSRPAVDDSLLQQEDGIQSAIAHCKKSFNASLA